MGRVGTGEGRRLEGTGDRGRGTPPAIGASGSVERWRAKRWASASLGATGVAGSVLCSFGMVAAAMGLFATGATAAGRAASMSGMGAMGDTHSSSGWLDLTVRYGPEILVASTVLVAAAVAIRRPMALLPAAVGAVVLYVGMYVQNSVGWMYLSIGVGMSLLTFAYVASLLPAKSTSYESC
jgi:hypothetical protein